VVLPPTAYCHLQLMAIGEDGSFLDAHTFVPIALEGICVLGKAIEEREYLTSDRLDLARDGSQFPRAAASNARRSILIIPIMASMALG
jgi:hypothetical protein